MEQSLSVQSNNMSIFNAGADFGKAMQMAKVLSASSMVPQQYQGERNIPNILIAMDVAHRMNMPPFQVMQNLYVIQGRPSWSSPFLIAMIEQSGKFDPLRFEMSGVGDEYGCVAWTTLKGTKERVEGPKVDMAMAKAEGWYQKNGSKWKTMPDLMLRYRAAAFFARLHAFDVACGLQTAEEVYDVGGREAALENPATPAADTQSLKARLLAESQPQEAEIVDEPQPAEVVVGPATPTQDEKSAVWREYLDLLGNKAHAMNAIKKITEGRGSDDWTDADLDSMRADLERRREAQPEGAEE
jgi:hypothetical protein